MSERFLRALWSASLVAVMASLSVPAHAADIRANVPFSFTVNGKTLPPGVYTLSTEQGHQLFVRGASNAAITLTNGVTSRDDTQPKLVFHRYGDQYILRQAWMGGGAGRELPQSRLERELLASARSGKLALKFERVAVAAE